MTEPNLNMMGDIEAIIDNAVIDPEVLIDPPEAYFMLLAAQQLGQTYCALALTALANVSVNEGGAEQALAAVRTAHGASVGALGQLELLPEGSRNREKVGKGLTKIAFAAQSRLGEATEHCEAHLAQRRSAISVAEPLIDVLTEVLHGYALGHEFCELMLKKVHLDLVRCNAAALESAEQLRGGQTPKQDCEAELMFAQDAGRSSAKLTRIIPKLDHEWGYGACNGSALPFDDTPL